MTRERQDRDVSEPIYLRVRESLFHARISIPDEMTVEHPPCGEAYIRAALSSVGHEMGRSTVKRILHDHRIAPAPERT